MASIAHALHLAAPILGKVASFAVSSLSGVDMPAALGTGAMDAGGYIDVVFDSDCYIAFGQTGKTVTKSGASAGFYVPTGVRMTLEYPSTSGYQYLYVSAATGTTIGWAFKSSFEDNKQYRDYIAGVRKNQF